MSPDKARKQARRAKNRRKRDREKARKNARGTPYRYYRFEVNGKVYKGFSVSDPSFTIGESIMIVYLPSDPSINYSSTYVDKYRAKLRKRQERRQKLAEKFRQ